MRGYHHQPPPPASAALNPPKRHPPFMCAQNNERKHIRIKQNPHPHGHPCQDRLRPPAPTPHTTTNITSHLIPPPERHGKSQNSSSPIHPFNTQPTQTPPPVCTTNTNGSSINNKATSWRPSAITSRRFKEFKGSFLAPQKKDTTTCPVHSDPQNHRRYQKEGMERTILSFRFSSSAGRQQEQDVMCWAS